MSLLGVVVVPGGSFQTQWSSPPSGETHTSKRPASHKNKIVA